MFAGAVSACAGSGSYTWIADVPEAMLVPQRPGLVAVGDVLSIRIFSQDAMNVRAAVRSEGTISMALIGDVRVVGRLPAEISKEIETRLQPFINLPHVTTTIDETHVKVIVAGEVRRPGTLNFDNQVDLLTALANAGGLTEFAGESDVYVLRQTPNGTYRIRFRWEDVSRGVGNAARFRLHDNDSVVVE